jgi:F-type H+-transporting ATPase subunit delta
MEIKSIVLDKIKSISNKKVEIKNIIDTSILGGFILRFEDKEYDASMISKLKKLKKELI